MVEKAMLYVQSLLILFLNVKLVTILEMEISLYLTESFKNSFFRLTIGAWYSLDPVVINSKSLEVFKSKLFAFIQPIQRSIYSVFNPQGLKFLT